MFNPGGFTDGDRAPCFIQALGRSLENVECIGFRTDVVGFIRNDESGTKKEKIGMDGRIDASPWC